MSLTKDQLLQQVKREILEITPYEVYEKIQKEDEFVLLDVREREEFNDGHLENAVFIPRGFLELRVENEIPDKDTPIVVYCAGGVRSALATKTLMNMGYKNVQSMVGGFNAWKEAKYKVVKPKSLTAEQRARYSRHLLIPEVGEKGQIKLLEGKILLIGAGGLGSPSAYYLAAAGVGTIGIVDSDVVDESNLQRQILHNTEWLGKNKVESAKEALTKLNPGINIIPYAQRLSVDNIDLIKDYDVIIDGSDNFKTRYMVNDACVFYNKPNIYGSIFRFEGQATTFIPGKGPCYRCLYPIPTPAELAPTCDEAGVLGVLPGVIGLLQATDAIKLILGIGSTMMGRLVLYDALNIEFRELEIRRDPNCAVCGKDPEITDFIDYDEFVGTGVCTLVRV